MNLPIILTLFCRNHIIFVVNMQWLTQMWHDRHKREMIAPKKNRENPFLRVCLAMDWRVNDSTSSNWRNRISDSQFLLRLFVSFTESHVRLYVGVLLWFDGLSIRRCLLAKQKVETMSFDDNRDASFRAGLSLMFEGGMHRFCFHELVCYGAFSECFSSYVRLQ